MDYDFKEDREEEEDESVNNNDIEDQIDLKKLTRDLSKELKNIKEEIREIKDEIDSEHPRKRKRVKPRKKTYSYSSGIEGFGENLGNSLENYIGSILDSVGEAIDRSVGSLFSTTGSRRHRKYDRHNRYITSEDLEEFFEKGSKIMSALSDPNRLRMLKILENEPLRQSDLADKTGIKGGNFKHHMKILIDQSLVRQEGVRERYMLTFAGREALKLAEFLYTRGKKRLQVPVIITDEDTEEE
ncbi:MAG: ArsR/SmtB family transcription factor [Candidatus Hodarchaeales archaeon]